MSESCPVGELSLSIGELVLSVGYFLEPCLSASFRVTASIVCQLIPSPVHCAALTVPHM